MTWTPVTITTEDADLPGDLAVPQGSARVVVFAHGSGSSRHSPRNRAVAEHLVQAGLGVLLFDLLTGREGENRRLVFDIPFLAGRLVGATQWLLTTSPWAHGPGHRSVGYFGASTGAGAALWAAADPSVAASVAAVVSRGGRPDLAQARLGQVRAPTLLIVGGHDLQVLDLNRRAQALLRCENHLAVVPGATHLFEEPGAMEQVAHLATDWFRAH